MRDEVGCFGEALWASTVLLLPKHPTADVLGIEVPGSSKLRLSGSITRFTLVVTYLRPAMGLHRRVEQYTVVGKSPEPSRRLSFKMSFKGYGAAIQ